MDVLLVAVVAAVVVVAVSALAPRVGVAAPLALVVIGLGVSVVPAVPAIELDPEVILAGVLPALLYGSAASFPSMDFRRDFTAISGMSVLLVVVSAVALGVVFSAMVPGIGLAGGIALGAIVSPTDAVATSIIKKLGAPRRVVVMLDGEGLLNDATSLVLLRSAVAATATTVSLWGVVGELVTAVLLAALVGVVVGRVGLWVRARLGQVALSTAVSFVVPFAAYLPAEALGASGIVAAVAAGLVTSALAARHLAPQDRVAEHANWRTVEGMLEGGLFLVMGLEVFALVEDVRRAGESLTTALAVAVVGAVGVVVLRAAFVLPLLALLARRRRRGEELRTLLAAVQARLDAGLAVAPPEGRGQPPADAGDVAAALEAAWPAGTSPRRRARLAARVTRLARADARRRTHGVPSVQEGADERLASRLAVLRERVVRRVADIDYLTAAPLGPREGVVLVWAGMRGVVTLAAAQTLPADFPQRSLLVLVALGVAVGTLLVQGGTLPWVVRRLGLAGVVSSRRDEGLAGLRDEVDAAARRLLDAPDLRRPDGDPYPPDVVRHVRDVVVREQLEQREDAPAPEVVAAQVLELRLAVIVAQREAVLAARSLGTYDSDLLSRALELLDADQLALEMRGHVQR